MPSSYINRLQKCLIQHGLGQTAAVSIALDMEKQHSQINAKRNETDWERLLEPLRKTIRGLQSSSGRWLKDTRRQPVYSKYLRLLLVTRTAIELERVKAGDTPIPTVAASLGLSSRGTTWQDWIRPSVKEKCVSAFSTLYDVTLLAGRKEDFLVGKRLIPFRDKQAITASDRRWDNMLAKLLTEREGFRNMEEHASYITCINIAIARIHAREDSDTAPVQWQHLLDDEHRAIYKRWQEDTTNGLHAAYDDHSLHIQAHQALQARVHAEAEAKRDKQRAYAKAHRDSKKGE